MTIAVSIRTGSAVVFAADSKLTTSGIVGIEKDGSPRWQDQTYDNAFKVVHDRSESLMVMVAGHASIGQVPATDYISTRTFGDMSNAQVQDQRIEELVNTMHQQNSAYWSKKKEVASDPDKWPGPTLLLAAPSPDGITPRVWRVRLSGAKPELKEIQKQPGIRLEGSYNEVFGLLYGFEPSTMDAMANYLGVSTEKVNEAANSLTVLRPIDKLNLHSLPIQDAVDLAVFLAKVQVQMDRFLPETPVCGGPIDVMVLQMAPKAKIYSYPGKVIHHPDGSP